MPAWIVILVALVTIYLVIQPSRPAYQRYLQLRRPRWFNFESTYTLIWLGFYVCFFFSARLVLERSWSWNLAITYLILVLLAQSVNWLVCITRSPLFGVLLGGMAWVWALLTLLAVAPRSGLAAALLLPYVLLEPVAILGRLQIHWLNPGARRSR
ncbi:MAG: tryptophan-rich sensory protein [Prochlorococcaceae cyanobacterium]